MSAGIAASPGRLRHRHRLPWFALVGSVVTFTSGFARVDLEGSGARARRVPPVAD